MKAAKMICLSGIIVLAMLVAALLLFVETKDAAFALKKDETIAIYYVDGSVADQEVTVERGQFITVSVEYNGEIYLPKLLTNNEKFAYSIDGNVFSINENSYIGGYLLLYAVITVGEEEIYIEPLTVVPVWESNFGEKIINESSYDYYKLSFSDENIISAKTNIKMLNGGVTGKVISDGEGIDDVINVAKHSYAGLSIEFEEVEVTTYDNLGNASVQTATNGADNLSLIAYATLSLSGSGTNYDPYLIGSVADMNLIPSYNTYSSFFRQTADITFDGTPSALVYGNFYGFYTGNAHTIYYNSISDVAALFVHTNRGTITNLKISIYFCYLNGYYSGGLCAINHGTIDNVSIINPNILVHSVINANSNSVLFCGGLVGLNHHRVVYCNVSIVISCKKNTGAIVGENNDTISECTMVFYNVIWNSFSNYNIGGIAAVNNSAGIITYNDIGIVLVFFNDYSYTALPKIGGAVGTTYNGALGIALSNTWNLDDFFYFFITEEEHDLTVQQDGYIGEICGQFFFL